jgi:Glycosyl hydrolases family 18
MRRIAPRSSRAWLLVFGVVFVSLAMAIYVANTDPNPEQVSATPTATALREAPQDKLDLAAYAAQPPAPRPRECGNASLTGTSGAWVVSWLEHTSQRDLLPEQARGLGLLDFFWLNVGPEPNRLIVGAPQARPLDTVLDVARRANPCTLRFVTIVDDRPLQQGQTEDDLKRVMARILLDPEARQQHVKAVAAEMARHPLAEGLTVDYEYGLPRTEADLLFYEEVGPLKGMSRSEQINYITTAYTELIRQLAEVMHNQQRLIRVAALVRTNDDVEYTHIAPYIWDYESLGAVVDQLVFMAYDFHWSTSDPGPISPAANVQAVWQYVNSHGVPQEKLALGVPAYGYDWIVDVNGKNSNRTQAQTVDATQLAAKNWPKSGEQDGETRYSYTDPQGRLHEVWDTTTNFWHKVALTRQLCGCGVTVWRIGNGDPVGSGIVLDALAAAPVAPVD